ncbi:hypothetical protein [Vibrio parahaemolyticus]|uniref:hypothetical protein n=1 Tax=Vibrio parahaemolyticus TaxID=670 RepID=UPI000870C02E|nr:hypothetical protein [Vibrio parahaemolyticus]AOV89752.1 hypothetical protein FORC23_1209 [Vibrio parahaemolyticus]MBE3794262.1 hypothetical protein [Vibrio parahaemolyticus]
MNSYKFELFADYFQLYLMDVEASDDPSEIWTEEALNLMLGQLPNTLAVGTFRNVEVPFEVEVYETKPDVNLDEWDHASKGYFTVKSGVCSVFGCTDYLPETAKIHIKPGDYAVLSLAKGVATITEEWGGADDLYKLLIWPSSSKEYIAIKRYENT